MENITELPIEAEPHFKGGDIFAYVKNGIIYQVPLIKILCSADYHCHIMKTSFGSEALSEVKIKSTFGKESSKAANIKLIAKELIKPIEHNVISDLYFEFNKVICKNNIDDETDYYQDFLLEKERADNLGRTCVKLQNQIVDLTDNTPPNKLNYDTIVKLRVKSDKLIVACCILSVALFCSLVYIAI